MPIPQNFPNDNELERIKTLGKYERLFENDQQSVLDLHERVKKQYKDAADLLYLGHALPSRISEFYGDFVQGEADEIVIDTTLDDQTEKDTLAEIVDGNTLKEKLYDYAMDQSEYGFEILLGRIADGKFVIDEVNQDQYFPQADGSVIFATYIRDPKATDMPVTKRDIFLYTQHYWLEESRVSIERRAWTTDTRGRVADPATLEYLGITDESDETIENMTRLPIVQIDNGRKTRFGFGKSDYADIMPQLAEINERTTHVATQLLKNLDAKLEMQSNKDLVDDDGGLKPFDYVMLPDKESVQTRYVTNDNPLIEETFKHVDRQMHFISWVTSVPMFELLESARPERAEALRIRLFNAVRKTDTKRSRIRQGIKDIVEIGFDMLERSIQSPLMVEFSSVLPHDPLAEVQVEQIKVANGLSSREAAIKRLEKYDEEEVEQEIERIQSEDIQSGAVNPQNPPQI